MNTTEEQIKTVEAIRDETLPHGERGEHAALTAILEELRESRELLEAATRVEFADPDSYGIERDWDWDSRFWLIDIPGHDPHKRFDSALAAFAEVKKQENL